MAVKLFRTSELKAPKATILVYAPAGWGKTYLARTLKNALVVGTEIGETSGLLTLSDLDITAVMIDNWADMTSLFTELQKVPEKCQYAGKEFDSVIIDSLTGCGDLWIEAGLKILSWKMAFDLQPGKDPRRMYSYVAEKGRQAMKMFFDTHAHLIFLCREGIMSEGEGEAVVQYAVPELPGQKLPKELPGWPDATLHGVWKNGKRAFSTRNKGKVVSRIRVPGNIEVPEFIQPNLELIIQLMLGDASVIPQLDFAKAQSSAAAGRS